MHGTHAENAAISAKKLLVAVIIVLGWIMALPGHAVTVTSQPYSITVKEGQSVSFRIAAYSSNRSTITYQWYKNNTLLNASTSSYTLSSAKLSDAGTYRCTVRDSASTYKCKSFSLKVTSSTQPVSITSQPANLIVTEGSNASLRVTATGSGTLTYQWYFNGSALSGATASTLSLGSARASQAGNYHVVVRNGSSSATSATASLTVLAAPTTRSARLSWVAPTQREDGSTLSASDISSYLVYYATSSSGALTLLGTTTTGTLTYLVSGLSTGTHYFAVAVRDIAGLEGKPSLRQSLTVP